VCTKEVCQFNDNLAAFQAAGHAAEVLEALGPKV
jgi:peroxiredoxin